jgi:hypothetical protein
MTVINNRISVANDWKAEMEAKRAFLQELIKNDDLDEAALEITKQVIAEGEDSLTPAQKFAFQRNVLRKFVTQKRQNGCDISWSEQYEALLNGGFCFYCYYGMTNYPQASPHFPASHSPRWCRSLAQQRQSCRAR